MPSLVYVYVRELLSLLHSLAVQTPPARGLRRSPSRQSKGRFIQSRGRWLALGVTLVTPITTPAVTAFQHPCYFYYCESKRHRHTSFPLLPRLSVSSSSSSSAAIVVAAARPPSQSSHDDTTPTTSTTGVERGRLASTPSLFALESSMYDEQRPRRLPASSATGAKPTPSSSSSSSSWNNPWGVRYYRPTLFAAPPSATVHHKQQQQHQPSIRPVQRLRYYPFPHTIDSVTDSCAHAICAVLSHNPPRQQRDTEAIALPPPLEPTTTTTTHSLVPRGYVNSGRLGIELDFGGGSHDASPARSHDEAGTVRYAALILAAKLSQSSTWHEFEPMPHGSSGSTTTTTTDRPSSRPVTVYFNTVQQALSASQQLLQLKRIERHRADSSASNRHTSPSTASERATIFDTILIRCLCQGDSIPNEMLAPREQTTSRPGNVDKRRRDYGTTRKATTNSLVDTAAGLILIVQPTDYNTDYQPPGPVVTAVEALQRLSAQASLRRLGVVVISPRFLNNPITPPCMYTTTNDSYFWNNGDENAFSTTQQSSSHYDGREPAIGPTPWIMRDFTPPVFTWVANALTTKTTSIVPYSTRPRTPSAAAADVDARFGECAKRPHHEISHLVVWQSILHRDTAWHLFAMSSSQSSSSKGHYRYIASTSSVAGRPTRDVIHELFLGSNE